MKTARRPDPEPLETDDVRIVAVGTALWAIALVVLVVARLAGAGVHGWWLAMCASGAALGLLGVRYCQRRRDAIARDRAVGGGVAESTPR
jgi:fatty acid desaturase